MVLEPNKKELMKMMGSVTALESYDGGDQGFLTRISVGCWVLLFSKTTPLKYLMPHDETTFWLQHGPLLLLPKISLGSSLQQTKSDFFLLSRISLLKLTI